ncbi:DUF2339 domain-containing protein [Williamsia sp. MIQD14]|uniref:DUF2339 domain-containing protein n=1 Tax=Williamsia sp. MIQD14 TaxID=3425703 RepID=UPI003DA041B4
MTDNEARPPRPDWTVLSRVSSDFASLSRQMAQMSTDLTDLRTTMTAVRPEPAPAPTPPAPTPPRPPAPPQPAWQPPPVLYPPTLAPPFVPPRGSTPPPWAGQPAPPTPPRPSLLRRAASATDGRLVGTILAVAGVGVTLVGVVLLLVLAAQAGILRPEVRVGAGGLLAAALVAIGARERRRGSRVGPIALVATGIGTAYLDIVAMTRIYHWLPAVAGLVLAGVVALAGLWTARRWGSEHLALLVVVPLIGAAPFVAGGIGLPLIGFMLVLAAITLPFGVGVGVGAPWANLQYARVAAAALWLVPTIVTMAHARSTGTGSAAGALDQWALAVACLLAALIALGGTLLTRGDSVHAVVAALGAVPALVCGVAIDRPLAAGTTAVVAVALTAMVTLGRSMLTDPLRITWGILAAVAALIAVPTAFGGPVAVPVLIGLALMITVVGRDDVIARGIGFTFTGAGALAYLSTTRLESLVDPTVTDTATAASSIVGGLLLAAAAMTTAGVVAARLVEAVWPWVFGGVVALYGITATAVTAGVAIGGTGAGFLAGHMAATIVWVCAAGAALVLAGRVPAGPARIAPIAGALTLAAAAVAKLIVFDLATLDGGFRVGAFVAVGLVLLTLGARYARTGQES